MEETIINILNILKDSEYCDSAEHLYDAIKNINYHLDNDDNLNKYVNDFLLALKSSTIICFDDNIKKCINLIENKMEEVKAKVNSILNEWENARHELVDIESELISLIAKTDNEVLQNVFLDFQNKRNECNTLYNEFLKTL